MTWQDGIALACVVASVAYLFRRGVRTVRGWRHGCTGCSGRRDGSARGPRELPLVSLDGAPDEGTGDPTRQHDPAASRPK